MSRHATSTKRPDDTDKERVNVACTAGVRSADLGITLPIATQTDMLRNLVLGSETKCKAAARLASPRPRTAADVHSQFRSGVVPARLGENRSSIRSVSEYPEQFAAPVLRIDLRAPRICGVRAPEVDEGRLDREIRGEPVTKEGPPARAILVAVHWPVFAKVP